MVDSASRTLRIGDLRPGMEVVVVAAHCTCPQELRLQDLGFTPGTRLKVVKRAPLGDPVQVEVRGCQMCLRQCEAQCLEFEVAE